MQHLANNKRIALIDNLAGTGIAQLSNGTERLIFGTNQLKSGVWCPERTSCFQVRKNLSIFINQLAQRKRLDEDKYILMKNLLTS